MDIKAEKQVSAMLKKFLGDEIWDNLSKSRRLSIILLVEELAFQLLPSKYGLKVDINIEKLEKLTETRLAQIESEELLAILNNKKYWFPEMGINDFNAHGETIFKKLRKKMDELIKNLRDAKFDKKVLQKAQAEILDAVDKRLNIPSTDIDLYVLEKVSPELTLLSPEQKAQIEEWLKNQE